MSALVAKKQNTAQEPAHSHVPFQRVGVFVDAQNMYHSAKNLYHAKVNFKKILEAAVGGRKLIRAFVYVIKTESGDENAFLEALEKSGYEIKIKDLQIFADGSKKADWDVGMAIDAVILADKIDVAMDVISDIFQNSHQSGPCPRNTFQK